MNLYQDEALDKMDLLNKILTGAEPEPELVKFINDFGSRWDKRELADLQKYHEQSGYPAPITKAMHLNGLTRRCLAIILSIYDHEP